MVNHAYTYVVSCIEKNSTLKEALFYRHITYILPMAEQKSENSLNLITKHTNFKA